MLTACSTRPAAALKHWLASFFGGVREEGGEWCRTWGMGNGDRYWVKRKPPVTCSGPTNQCCVQEPALISHLVRIINCTSAKIVLSSTWRVHERLVEKLRQVSIRWHGNLAVQYPSITSHEVFACDMLQSEACG